MNDLRRQTLSGLRWSAAAQVVRQLIQFTLGVVIARLLTPDAYGLIGMIVVFTGFGALFGDLGLGAAIIYKEDIEHWHLTAIFWVNLLAGVALAGIFFAAAPWIADFYDETVLVPLTRVLSVQFLIQALAVVQGARLRRAMAFRTLAYVETTAVVVAGAVGIGMAFSGLGVWALVGQALTGAGIGTAGLWLASGWQPGLRFRGSALRDVIGYSSNLLGFNVFNYWVRNLDNLLIGRVVGSAGLGLYTKAYGLMLLPLRQIQSVLSRVMFPALSRLQNDVPRVKRVYLQAIRSISLISSPMMLGLFVVAEHFVIALFGQHWAGVVPILRVLALVGVAQSIGTTTGWIFNSQGRTDVQFRWGLIAGLIRAVSFVLGVQWGVMGVAWAYLLTNYLVLWYPTWRISGGIIGLTVGEMLRELTPTLTCAAVMGASVWGLDVLLPDWPHWTLLVLEVTFGAGVYLALLEIFKVEAYDEARGIIVEEWRSLQSQDRKSVATGSPRQQ